MEGHDLAKQFFETDNDMLRAKGLMLQSGKVIDATIIAAPSPTKNSTGKRDPEMHQTNTRIGLSDASLVTPRFATVD
jgi:transposase, IS5 family